MFPFISRKVINDHVMSDHTISWFKNWCTKLGEIISGTGELYIGEDSGQWANSVTTKNTSYFPSTLF